jgi:glycosyltransferase involved in cell wall biosynthesis
VNDGSSDKTGEIINRLGKRYKQVRPIHHKANMGLGNALRTGVKSCKKDIVIYIEGDGQSLLKDQGELLKKLKLLMLF